MAPSASPLGGFGASLEDMVNKAVNDNRPDDIEEAETEGEIKWAERLRKERDNLIAYLEEVS